MTHEEKVIPNAYFDLLNKDNYGLTEGFSVNPVSCENSDYYPNYLRFCALSDQNAGKSTTHLFINEKDNAIMGFLTLRASSLIERNGDQWLGKPALEVSVLAVSENYTRIGVGRALINLAIEQAAHLHEEHLGVRYIVLASDKQAVGFYEHMGFSTLSDAWENVLPRDKDNTNCPAMYMELSFENYEQYASFDDDDE